MPVFAVAGSLMDGVEHPIVGVVGLMVMFGPMSVILLFVRRWRLGIGLLAISAITFTAATHVLDTDMNGWVVFGMTAAITTLVAIVCW